MNIAQMVGVEKGSGPGAPKKKKKKSPEESVMDRLGRGRKRRSAGTSIYTSPLGVSGEANIARKTLLGQ